MSDKEATSATKEVDPGRSPAATTARGLLAIAVDPDWVHNHYLYLLYNVDPDTNGVDLDVPLPAGVNAVQKDASPLIDLAANTLSALGGRSPEKWEGLTVGPQLNDGSFLMLAGRLEILTLYVLFTAAFWRA